MHRDVKPSNVLIDERGEARLTDFGVAFDGETVTRLTQEQSAVGTLAYMSPEQMLGKPVDARADVYSLGATLYEALAGRPAFDAPHPLALLAMVADSPPPALRESCPDVPPELEECVLACLSKRAEERYPTARELALDLARHLAGEPTVGPAGRARARTRARRWAIVASSVCLCALAIAAAAWTASSSSGGLDQHGLAPSVTTERPQAPPTESVQQPRIALQGGTIVNVRDRTALVWIEPAEFVVGGRVEDGDRPVRRLRLERGFYIGKHEVTWAQYRRFCADTRRPVPSARIERGGAAYDAVPQDPAFSVSFDDAWAYASWAGGRLPTDLEWECAARGREGRRYPWGDRLPRGRAVANLADERLRPYASADTQIVNGYDDGFAFVAPCGSFPDGASSHGCLDMAGNVAEWVELEGGPATRGGGWTFTDWGARSTALVAAPRTLKSDDLGFRIVVDGE